MADIKDRKVYGLTNFRGLDRENKPLKVSPFRASEGKNFIIDSETLKTRPAFKYLDTPLKNIDDVEIIDFYNFKDIYIYITTKGFQIKYGDKILKSTTTPRTYSNFVLDFNFQGMKPFFQEEKDCLFIFCLDDIFVVSNFYNEVSGELEWVIMYSLSDKPNNPFVVSDNYYEAYEELPIPYEPTLYIGDNFLDDVNLLSKVSKYEMFAQNSRNSQEGMNVYNLPTHYDPSKHGDSPKIAVSFYKKRFESLEIFPIYLGKLGENFYDINIYGNVINDDNPIVIQEDYVAEEIFEYKWDRESNPIPIKEILGLTKEAFFELKIKENSQKVFEYILNYIEINFPNNEINTNKVLKFTLPYERTSYYRNASTNDIEKVYKEKREENIYLQLKKFAVNEIAFINKETKASATSNEQVISNPYPSYPSFSTNAYLEINITTSPVNKPNYTTNDFISMANTWLELNKFHDDFHNGNMIKLLGRFYETKQATTDTSVRGVEYWQDWNMSVVDEVSTGLVEAWIYPSLFPPFPSFNPGSNPVIDIGILSTSGESISPGRFVDEVKNAILGRINELPGDKSFGYCKFRWKTIWDDGLGTFYEKGQSIVAEFSYTKGSTYTYQRRNSFAMMFKVAKDETNIVDGLYEINFDENINCFVLKCKDYFYDFNNEPSIDVRIVFQQNPDFNIIAKSKFGITFGSENRLFLAGNEEYPHIDRFNVSNDLLGNNEKKQSYELSYFPSKNYRVLGGKGAINGYVLATDTQLYITKEEYPNDQKLFIRNRTMDDNGLVGYNEFKTNIDKTPLNNRSLARFYNDIVVLDKKGLYGIEIASNVLTNERLVKMRSGFTNKALTKDLMDYGTDKVFIYEDNAYMYIFIGKKVYVADSRYISHNPNSEIENYSYEIVEWEIPFEFKMMKKIHGEILLLDSTGKHTFTIVSDNNDDYVDRRRNYLTLETLQGFETSYFKGNDLHLVVENEKGLTFTFDNDNIFKLLAKQEDYSIVETSSGLYEITIINQRAFRDIVDGDYIAFKDSSSNTFTRSIVYDFDNDRISFRVSGIPSGTTLTRLYTEQSNKKLYIKGIFIEDGDKKRVILSPYEMEEVETLYQLDGETNSQYLQRIALLDDDYCSYIFEDKVGALLLKDVLINRETKIMLKWISAVLDFGNNFSEKTMFKTNIYATKQEKENWIKLGYRTMRRFNRFDETGQSKMMKGIEASNPMDFNEVNFNVFAINTLNEFGASIPMKENNFLYIQFMVLGDGNIEINAIEILYKLNRMLKTIS